jgi:hypothetical protein
MSHILSYLEILEPPVSDSYLDDSSVSIDSQNPENEGNLDSPGDITPQDENEVISGTLSSPDISDHEIQTEDMSHDDSAEHIVVRERRDSGVGSSLTRTNRLVLVSNIQSLNTAV